MPWMLVLGLGKYNTGDGLEKDQRLTPPLLKEKKTLRQAATIKSLFLEIKTPLVWYHLLE